MSIDFVDYRIIDVAFYMTGVVSVAFVTLLWLGICRVLAVIVMCFAAA